MLSNSILTNRYISVGKGIFVLGGSFTSPFFFILGDIIAEIFGYKISKRMIWYGFASQIIFALICGLIIYLTPYPIFFKNQYSYSIVLGQLFYIVASSFIAFIISGFVNITIITKWKILLRGKHFWLRSLGSSTIAEALYSLIAIFMMEVGTIPIFNIWKVILISYLIKVIYSIVLAGPTNILVNYIKEKTKIDVYDYPDSFNPFENNSAEPKLP